jgi:hypothetical protein
MKEMSAMKRFSYCIVGLTILGLAGSCGKDENGNPINPLDKAAGALASACGLACPGEKDSEGVEVKGVLEGNASISGVAKVDAFFASVNNFRAAADGVSAGIEAQLKLIKADFGIAADADLKAQLDAKIKANIEGSLVIDYQPPVCAVDASATVEASARCEAMVNPGSVSVDCKGSCELKADAELKCDAGAQLECEFTGPTVDCKGECTGSCEAKIEGSAACSGTCRGTCSGNCSAYSDSGAKQCAGSCDGMCTGSCEAKADASVKCMGTCNGSCKVTGAAADCMGSAHASCKAMGSASVKCEGKCEGDIEPPSASAECKASAKAEAKINVQCTPPTLAARYRLKAGVDATAQAQFEAALKTLISVRLPALTASIKRGQTVGDAGEDLALAAKDAVKASVDAAIKGDLGIRATFGLRCAAKQLPDVEMAVADSADHLTDQLNDGLTITAALGMTK